VRHLPFPLTARGETIRYIFAFAEQEYEEKVIQFKDWPEYKKTATLPFGQIPVVQHDDFVLSQSNAIVIYLSQTFNFWPTNPKCAAFANSLVLACEDVKIKFFPAFLEKNEEEKKKKVEEYKTYFDGWQKNISKLLGDKKYFVGTKLTGAGIAVFDILHNYTWGVTLEKNLQEFKDRVAAEKGIAEYLSKQKK